jgi:hypothetical protein
VESKTFVLWKQSTTEVQHATVSYVLQKQVLYSDGLKEVSAGVKHHNAMKTVVIFRLLTTVLLDPQKDEDI